uniref:Metallo-beta-lactamase domain-containing protein n=1 Tax=Bicosoecida sp. CB-2014 TaxID=1486930 RepID=A0A7S1CR69_9STRA|mmetsp:Transcript_8367/g.29745  ORF Transcript_8367/g.29745 Transcript_8367/m.29745 type:complete len:380 (+) Transcript_8367:86-1225(+)
MAAEAAPAVAAEGSATAASTRGDAEGGATRERPADAGRDTFTFMGTGTSEGVPRVSCLTRTPVECEVCARAALARPGTPLEAGGCRDRRGNTGAIVRRWSEEHGRHLVILIDCGKLWWESAIELFPRLGVDRLDAVVITHGHFDAMGGLDSLRDYTRPPVMSDGDTLPVYVDDETFAVVDRSFPYLTDTGKATGGGDVPTLSFRRFRAGEPFAVAPTDVTFTPYWLQHGPPGNPLNYCNGFRVGDIAYASDVSAVPAAARALFDGARTVVMDCLWLKPEAHPSHYGLEQALEEHGRGYRAPRGAEGGAEGEGEGDFKGDEGAGAAAGGAAAGASTWLVGFNHTVSHDETEAAIVARGIDNCRLAYDGLTIDVDFADAAT